MNVTSICFTIFLSSADMTGASPASTIVVSGLRAEKTSREVVLNHFDTTGRL